MVAMVFSVALAAGLAALVVVNDRPAPQPIPAEPAEALAVTSAPQPEPRAEPRMEWAEPREAGAKSRARAETGETFRTSHTVTAGASSRAAAETSVGARVESGASIGASAGS